MQNTVQTNVAHIKHLLGFLLRLSCADAVPSRPTTHNSANQRDLCFIDIFSTCFSELVFYECVLQTTSTASLQLSNSYFSCNSFQISPFSSICKDSFKEINSLKGKPQPTGWSRLPRGANCHGQLLNKRFKFRVCLFMHVTVTMATSSPDSTVGGAGSVNFLCSVINFSQLSSDSCL